MKLIYTDSNRILVELAKTQLENAAIPVCLKNEFSGAATGDLAPTQLWLELWVINHADYARAEEILAKALNPIENENWQCFYCKEVNEGTFEVCWNCQYPSETA